MEAYPSDSLLGSVVDRRYRIDERVGAGAFGCVYAAWHLSLDVRVALKVLTLDVELSDDERAKLVARFLNEARVLTRLKHPHIVAAIDLGTVALAEDSAVPYLVMEWCAGQTLKQLLGERGPLAVAEAYEIAEPLADALAHAHAMGVLHRDIKPSNVMLSRVQGHPSPQLIDFGIAKHSPPRDPSASTESVTIGAPPYTPAYAAPEQVAGARTGPATDVHALGLLFIELVTGSPPYGNRPDPELAIIDATRPDAGAAAGAFQAVVAKAVSLKAGDRYPDGRALRDALRNAARTELGEAHPIPSARVVHRRRWPRVASFALLLVGVLALAVWSRPWRASHEVPSASPPNAAFCQLDEAAQRDRLADEGLDTVAFEAGWALLGGDADHVVTVEWEPSHAPQETLSRDAVAIAEIDSLGLAYAVDDGCLLYARGPRAELRRALDNVLAGRTPQLRGDTIGGPNPLAIGRPAAAPWLGPRATHLGGLSHAELLARALATGVLVYNADRSDKQNGAWFQLRFKQGQRYGRFEYLLGPYVRSQLLEKLGTADGVVYYAIEEPVTILAHGLTDPSLLETLLTDLGASVQKSPP